MKPIWKRALSLALTLSLCAGLLSAFALPASAVSLEEKQRAAVLTAFAYYDKGRPVQYDSGELSIVRKESRGALRITHEVPPEYGTPDETIYSVCSDFCYQVYYDAFGYRLCGDPVSNWTGALSRYEPGTDPICAHQYRGKTSGEEGAAAVADFVAALQPGDVINAVSFVGNGGHAMFFIGDAFGDGKKYILHCGGDKYDTQTGEDVVECSPGKAEAIPGRIKLSSSANRNDGAILLNEAEDYLRTHFGSVVLSAIRPLNVIRDEEYPMTDAARGRLQYPRLVIDRTASGTRFNDVEEGGKLTLSIRLKNCSDKAYTLPVTETVPAGVTLKTVSDGGRISGSNISWTVQVPAGESKTLTCDYAVTAKRGETITLGGGKVGTIPSNAIRIPVGGRHLTAEENAILAAVADGAYADVLKDANKNDFVQRIYRDVLKLGVAVPASSEQIKGLIQTTTFASKRLYLPREDLTGEALTFREMFLPEFAGGFCWGEMDSLHRVLDLRCAYLQPGDILFEIVGANNLSNYKTFLYAGNETFLQYNNKAVRAADAVVLQKAHTYDLFFVLRPTLAYDDVHTLPALAAPAKPWKFTDVKESDWFYPYVRDLVKDGTVNGMTETTFEPNGILNYGQALKLIALAVGEQEPAKSGTHWASGYLTLAKSKGWLAGDVDPDDTITRLELCKIAAKAKNLTALPESNPFTDTDDEDVLALCKAGVVNGMTENTFLPEGELTRAQIAKIIRTLRDV